MTSIPIEYASTKKVKVSSIAPNAIFSAKAQISVSDNGETRLRYISGVVMGLEVDLETHAAVLTLTSGVKINGRIAISEREKGGFYTEYFVFG